MSSSTQLPLSRGSSNILRSRPTVLAVDDDDETLEVLEGQLERAGYTMFGCSSAEHALRDPRLNEVDVVVSDVHLGGMDGIRLCQRLSSRCPQVPVVVVTAFADVATERAAFAAGAFDFVPKPVHVGPQFLHAVKRASEHRKRERELETLERLVASMTATDAINACLLKRLFSAICDAASSSLPVSIVGDNATMRYAVARAIHEASAFRRRPLVVRDCSVIPPDLLGNELFGRDKPGKPRPQFGSVFLQDVDHLAPNLQGKLLRSLTPDSDSPESAASPQFRVLVGSESELQRAVHVGRFSEDLYCLLTERCISLPSA